MTSVNAFPAKRFFVSMLTRDIELADAIMDLLDNCVDGVLRELKDNGQAANPDRPYEGYWARIVANPTKFSISDNCGGIPKDVAEESAFRLGRVDVDKDKEIATVGMYGIGMKRALFKLGKSSRVTSRHGRDSYFVEISPEWMEDDDAWKLTLVTNETGTNADGKPVYEPLLGEDGTEITVSQLHEPIALQFDEAENDFLGDLKDEICRFYSLILQKGFRVYLNDEELSPVELGILVPTDFTASSISPYAYRGTVDNVKIELFVGFYRRLASEGEVDRELTLARTSDNAGWTVICNDRVVLFRDKSPITGWGSGDVPKYHPQYIAIAGVVRFSSDHPLNLPLNTTKRGLDTSSPVYWHARRFMQEGLKKFTDFTYHWKGQEEDTNARFELSAPQPVTEVIRAIPASAWKTIRNVEGERFVPELPRPAPREAKKRISFMRLEAEIATLGQFYFDDASASPADVGSQSFDDALVRAREAKR